MRVVSLVPSWTETLIEAGVNVVGRTRYCIHPSEQVAKIPIVGGTKDVSWALVADLKPDLILFDKEENPLEMSEECPFKSLATHVYSLESLQYELARLGNQFENSFLIEQSLKVLDILETSTPTWDVADVPGLLEWIEVPKGDSPKKVVYLIWKKPWMAVSKETYIGSVLRKLGAELVEFDELEKYPLLEIENYRDCLFLFSTEPFPFHSKKNELKLLANKLGLSGALVNGESFSWFGTRSLSFLSKKILVDKAFSSKSLAENEFARNKEINKEIDR